MLQTFDERNRDLLININGELSHRDEAGVSPFDSSVQGGDAVWEGLRVYNGRIFRLKRHLDRLRSSAEAVDFKDIPSHEQIIAQVRRTLGEFAALPPDSLGGEEARAKIAALQQQLRGSTNPVVASLCEQPAC